MEEKVISQSENASDSSVLCDANKKKPFKLSVKLILFGALALSLVAIIVLSIILASTYTELKSIENKHMAVYGKDFKGEVTEDGDMVEVFDFGLSEGRIPAYPGVLKELYEEDNIVTGEDGFKRYYVDGELCSYVGIDVSEINGEIDWDSVKAAGVDFVMVRLGGRGYGEAGIMYSDTEALSNIRGAKKAGLWVGAYFFSQAISPQEAAEEAEYAVNVLGGETLHLPLTFDWEYISYEGVRTDGITAETLTSCARAFCDKVAEKGYKPMIYTNKTLAYYKYNLTELADVDLWYASYSDTPTMYYNYTMWQYSCEGSVPGIYGDVDMNICFKNYR